MSTEREWRKNDWRVPPSTSKPSIQLSANSSLTIPLRNEATKENLDTKQAANNLNSTIRARRMKRSSEAIPEAPPIPPIPYYLRPHLRALGPKLTPQLQEILDTEIPDATPSRVFTDLVPPPETWLGHQNLFASDQQTSIEHVFAHGKNDASRARLVLFPALQPPSEHATEDLIPPGPSMLSAHLRIASSGKLGAHNNEAGREGVPFHNQAERLDAFTLDSAISSPFRLSDITPAPETIEPFTPHDYKGGVGHKSYSLHPGNEV